jgi:hypothetical protein
MLGAFSVAVWVGKLHAGAFHYADFNIARSQSTGMTVADSGGLSVNPHSDLIFRATGARSCQDCHRAGKEGELTAQVLDNVLVQELKAKAKGIHGPGRFADCLRCHAGGSKGVEKYQK